MAKSKSLSPILWILVGAAIAGGGFYAYQQHEQEKKNTLSFSIDRENGSFTIDTE